MRSGLLVTQTLLLRYRVGLATSMALLAVMACSVMVLKSQHLPDTLLFCGSATMVLTFLYIFATFIQADADVLSAKSSFPSNFFTLPVKTANLVAWPILTSVILVGLVAYLFTCALSVGGYSVHAVETALTTVACLTSLQAVLWSPMPVAYVRLLLAVGLIIVIPGLWPYALSHDVPIGAMSWVFCAITAGGACCAWAGVHAARLGSGSRIRGVDRSKTSAVARPPRKPFAGPMSAQAWYEWRQHGRIMPIMVGIGLIMFVIAKQWFDTTLSPLQIGEYAGKSDTGEYSTFVQSFILVPFLAPAFIAWVVGLGMRKSDLQPGKRTLHVFFATRPTSDFDMVRAKFRAALKSTSTAWALLLLTVLFFLLFTSGQTALSMRQYGALGATYVPSRMSADIPLYRLIFQYVEPHAILSLVSLGALLALFTWRNYVTGLWIDLSGRFELRYLWVLITLTGPLFLAFVDTAIRNHFGMDAGYYFYEVMVLVGTVVKFSASGWLTYRGIKNQIFSVKQIGRIWMSFACVLTATLALVYYGVFGFNSPSELSSTSPGIFPFIWFPALLVLFYVPLTRLILAPIALNRNRHAQT